MSLISISLQRLNQSKEIGNLINLTLSHYSSRHIRLFNGERFSEREQKKKNQESIFIFQHCILDSTVSQGVL